MSPPTLETARLRLRPLVATDAVALNRIQSDAAHMRFYPHPFSLEESRQWIERMLERYARDGIAVLAVEDRASGELLGNVGPLVQRVDGVDEVELGWSITPDRARQGSPPKRLRRAGSGCSRTYRRTMSSRSSARTMCHRGVSPSGSE